MKFVFCLIVMVFWSSTVFGGEIIRGDFLAERGKVISRSQLTILPHLELEYGVFDISGGFVGSLNDTGVAAGITIGKNNFFTDFYTRQSLSSGDSSMSVLGVNLTSINRDMIYTALGIEQVTIEIEKNNDFRQYYKSEELRIKPSIGGSVGGKNSVVVVGLGLIFGFSDIEVDQTKITLNNLQQIENKRYTGSGKTKNIGIFCQLKYGYSFTDNFTFLASLGADLETSIEDFEIDDEIFGSNHFMLYSRVGAQYRF